LLEYKFIKLCLACSLQNDGSSSSEETTEATDTNQESDTSAITPVPDEHFLQFTYCFWFSRFNGKNVDAAAFERNMKVIGTFDTVRLSFYSFIFCVNASLGKSLYKY